MTGDEEAQPLTPWEGPATAAPAEREAGSEPAAEPTANAAPAAAPSPAPRLRGNRLLLLFLLVSQLLLLVIVLVPEWWAGLPILSLWGVVGWKKRWYLSPLLGFLLGFGFWGFELELLPGIPRARLAAVIAGGLGSSSTVALLIGPLLFGFLAALGATTVAGALRFYDDVRPLPEGDGPSAPAGPNPEA